MAARRGGSSAFAKATADRSDAPPDYDVAVLGGGNAALCAALTAREAGCRVVIVERAPRHMRGGNSRHTRNLRCAHGAPTDVLTDAYEDGEFLSDLHRVNGGESDAGLSRLLIEQSRDCAGWMERHGVRFQAALRGTLHLSRTNAFFLGGGKALMNAYYAAAARLGIDVLYDADVVALELDGGRFRAATIVVDGEHRVVRARAAVVATGGFEANLEWLKEAWGAAAEHFIVRGTPYNTGAVLRLLLDAGAVPVGDPRGCHAIAVDARAPRFDGGIVTRLDCIPLGIVVNRHGDRFADEGQDLWPKRYASWGALVMAQPDQEAYCLVDAKAIGRFMPSVFPPFAAPSIRELASGLGLAPDRVVAAVEAFNHAVQPGTFDLETLDGCRTAGLTPPKSHWAQRLDTPPFWGYPLRPGITFTYLGVTVDHDARVVIGGAPSQNLFAAGEVMAGNVLRRGYLAGIGMTIGTVFGRLAGQRAADAAR
ncbi:MAG TPA: FAD-dependent tricarballylate dehydrogenase TcuA [Vicinamibacterales bacterium]|nr:FAD-dependent tricarballylate dehydrogenase TcuA [Vicinamibacterales bacterium]